jgi:hypothetical protein
MTWELLQFCRRENIVLIPRHIPGKHNILADALSRSNKLVSTEWTLHMDIVQAVRDRLPQYMSPLPDTKALAVNALAVSWDGMIAYAFPPTPLIQAVLNKVMTDKVRTLFAQPSMVFNSTRVVDRPPQETPRVGSPPLAPFRASLPQLPFFF